MSKSEMKRIKEIIMQSKDIKFCMNYLNQDIKSLFLLYLYLLEEAITDYNPINDYEYLLKISIFINDVYQKLSKNKKILYKQDISKLKKIYKTFIGVVDSCDQEYFRKVYHSLNNLISNTKQKNEVDKIDIDDNIYDIIYEAIFNFNHLEYIDLLFERNPELVNIQKNDIPIFMIIFQEYLKSLKENDSLKVSYYIRVLYKFFNENKFDLTNEMRDSILNNINDFLNNNNININKKDLEDLKNLIAYIKNQYVLNNYNINFQSYDMKNNDLESLSQMNEKIKHREKIDDYIITVDPSDTYVLDDAISITKLKNGNLSFKVHIVDPLSIFPYQSTLIQDAKSRTTTIYELNPIVEMLPKILSNDKLSLIEGKLRPTKTFCFEFSPNGDIVNFNILNTCISVNKRLTFDEVNNIYKKGGINKLDTEMYSNYEQIVNILKKIFKNAKIYEEFKSKNIIGNHEKMGSFSESLIGYSMMFTGYMTSKYFFNNKFPYAYRCHQIDEKWQELLNKYINDPNNEENIKIFKEIKEKLPKSYYSSDNTGHMGLKIPYYSHITSPLRRFCDILNIHCIDMCYFNNFTDRQLYKLEKEVDLTCDYLNIQSNSIDEYLSKVKKNK